MADFFGPSLIERWFPSRELSELIAADRRGRDPAYSAHRWWARRPPALMRAILLGASMNAAVSSDQFWQVFLSGERYLKDVTVYDPFVGGGATLLEAARLGANVVGKDVDPLAVSIVEHQLSPPRAGELLEAGEALLADLVQRFSVLYPSSAAETPLHYFYVPFVTCPTCGKEGRLYRDPVLARSIDKPGAVVRESAITAFCPIDLSIHYLAADAMHLDCCGVTQDLYSGTYVSGMYVCDACGERSSHRRLRTGVAHKDLVGVEVTTAARRRIRRPTEQDHEAIAEASAAVSTQFPAGAPIDAIPADRRDARPRSFGFEYFADLFTERQLLVLSAAFAWIREASLEKAISRALRLAVSNSLSTNNKLCGYARDYGRLSALFSIRGYALPSLSVELNPLHPSAGRGTLQACVRRVARSASEDVSRYVWNTSTGAPERVEMKLGVSGVGAEVSCSSALDLVDRPFADVVVFDPPYFDYIAYDELSEFHRAWDSFGGISGEPLLPDPADPVGSFGMAFGEALSNMRNSRIGPAPLVFTFHSPREDAWSSVGVALDEAKLRVTAVWPVRSDGQMGHHSRYEGACEWDLVVVCRTVEETVSKQLDLTLEDLVRLGGTPDIGEADLRGFRFALEMMGSRFGVEGEAL